MGETHARANMITRSPLLHGGLAIVWLAAFGCGGNPPASGPHNTILGGVVEGTPFGAAGIDKGLLKDQTGYKPEKPPGTSGGSSGSDGGTSVAAGAGDVKAEVIAMLDGGIQAVLDGEIDAFLNILDDAQIAPLKQDSSDLIDTHAKLAQLVRVIGGKIGKEDMTVRQLLEEVMKLAGLPEDLRSMSAATTVEVTVVDAENATIKPITPPGGALALPGLPAGGADATPEATPIPVKKTATGWKIQLPSALTAEQMPEFKRGLKLAQKFLDKLTEKIEGAEFKTLEELGPMLMMLGMTTAAEVQAEAAGEAEAVSPSEGDEPPAGDEPDAPVIEPP